MQSSDVGRLESNGTSVLVPTQCNREEKNKQKTQLNKREQANQIYVLNFCAKIFLSHAGWQKLADFCAPPKIQQTSSSAHLQIFATKMLYLQIFAAPVINTQFLDFLL